MTYRIDSHVKPPRIKVPKCKRTPPAVHDAYKAYGDACIHSAIAPNMNSCINCGKVWTGERWEAEKADSVEAREGYSACLHTIRRDRNPYFPQDSKPAVEWFKGWDKAAREIKGKR